MGRNRDFAKLIRKIARHNKLAGAKGRYSSWDSMMMYLVNGGTILHNVIIKIL